MFKFDELEEKRRRRIRQFIDLCHRHVAEYSVLSTEPLIFLMPISINLSDFVRDYKLLFESLKDRKAYLICSTYWNFENPENIQHLKRLLKQFRVDYPRFTFTFLCNTIRQLELFAKSDIDSVFCSNNCFIDEKLFFPIPGTVKQFDAVYDGRLAQWKRHSLAAEIESLGLIYYALPWYEDNSYMKEIMQNFDHAHFFNHDPAGEYRKLWPGEINNALNQCRVGLCLSAEEGAMYASVQYLLAGLPIVATPSLGGRDVFFDDEIAITVEPAPEAVAKCVKEMIVRDLDPRYVREKTLTRMKVHRNYFIDLVQSIYDREGVARDFSSEWDSLFFNKLFRNMNHMETVKYLTGIQNQNNGRDH
jgi:glycosyltransferase involved in cell wall biosynthesis